MVMVIIYISLIICGGFFLYSSAFLNIILSSLIVAGVVRNKKLRIEMSWYLLSLIVLCISYIIVIIYSVDKGLSAMGIIKFLPVLLFCVLLNVYEVDRKKIAEQLPLCAGVMTVIAFILYMIKPLRQYFSVSDRLSGTFQYPNSFAMFLLISIMLLVNDFKLDKKKIIRSILLVVLIGGIAFTGSRAVLVLLVPAVLGVIFIRTREGKAELVEEISKKKELSQDVIEKNQALGSNKMRWIIVSAIILATVIIVGAIAIGTKKIAFTSSTLFGRLLYWKDALIILKKYPFGVGYYGYSYIQGFFQTGNYKVVNVHNDILQFMLDVGILPGIVFFAAYVRGIITRKNKDINRWILLIFLMHILFDFDLQFVSLFMLIALFMPEENVKTFEFRKANQKDRSDDSSNINKLVVMIPGGMLLAAIVIFSILIGMSDLFDYFGLYNRSLKMWKNNTNAKVHMLKSINEYSEGFALAMDILSHNEYVDDAYSFMAANAFYSGDVGLFEAYQNKAIEYAPYEFQYYYDYIEIMSYSAEEFINAGDKESAVVCYEGMVEMEDRLESLADRTSSFSYRFTDKPVTEFPSEYKEKINSIKGKIIDK